MRSRLLAGSLLTAVAVSVTACGAGSSGDETTAAAADSGMARNAAGKGADAAQPQDYSAAGEGANQVLQQRAVISTGQVELTGSNVSEARGRVDTILAQRGGRIADENTQTDDRGNVTRAHLVVRVPSDRFAETMTDLAGVATLRSSTRKAQDVTTQVIDTDARIAAERAGVHRLRQLVSRAANLPALLAVERELTARQGQLESLRQQRAYLSDETSLATITVDIERQVTPSPAKRSTGGFVGGLSHGWRGLVAVVVALLVALGALLPFAVALVLVGLPTWFVVRRFRRLREPEAPAES
jgi:hypothetical protein